MVRLPKQSAPSVATPGSSTGRGVERLLAAVFFLWLFLTCCYPLVDTDFWWHLRTGELIAQRGEIPQVDWYTFTDYDRPWIDLHWGFQLALAGLYHLGGLNLVILVKAALLTLTVAIGWFAPPRGLPVWGRAAIWVLPAIALTGRGDVRPEVVSLLFLSVWLAIVMRLDRTPDLIWWLPLLQVLWVNCHGLFVLGLVVGACYAIDRLCRWWARGRFGLEPLAGGPSLRVLLWAAGLTGLACFLNPYVEEGAFFPLVLYKKFSTDRMFYSRIGEFQPPLWFVQKHGLKNLYVAAEFATWCLGAVSFAWLARCKRVNLLRMLLFASFSHLAWQATRNTNIFAVVTGCVIFGNFADALRLKDATPPGRWRGAATAAGLTVLGAFIAAVLSGTWNGWGDGNKPFGLGEADGWFAHGAAKFAGRSGMPERAFVANHGQAGVYIYHNAPGRLVFMDGRLEVSTQKTFELYEMICAQIAGRDRRWEAALRDAKGQLPAILLDSRFARPQIAGLLATPGWRMVFADPAGALFIEDRLAKKLALAPADPLPLRHPPGTRLRQGPP